MGSWKERIASFKQQRIVQEASDQQRILLLLFILGWENSNSIYPHEIARSHFLIDSFLHEGTSGSPVLLKPSLLNRNIDSRARLNLDSRSSFERKLLGIHSGSFIPMDWDPCNEGQLGEKGCPRLGLNEVWFASLIPKIIEENKSGNSCRCNKAI
jgi:hypothetical protein